MTAFGRPVAARADPAWVPTIALGSLEDGGRLFDRAEFLVDPGHRLDLPGALAADWRPMTRADRNQGITDAAMWLRFVLVNDTDRDREIVVTHDIAHLTEFVAHVRKPDGDVTTTRFDPYAPFAQRPLAYAAPAAPIDVPAGERREVVVTFHNAFAIPMHVSLRLWSERGFDREAVRYAAYVTFWTTCLLAAAVFWGLYGVCMRQMRMVTYAAYMAGLACTYVGFSGIGYQLLYPDRPWLQQLGYHWSMFMLSAAALDFARRQLDIASRHPRHDAVMRAGTGLLLVCMVLALVRPWPALEAPITFVALTASPVYIACLSWVAWRREDMGYALWMFVGWAAISVTIVLGVFGALVNAPFGSWSQMDFLRLAFALTVLESVLLSVSLAQWLRGQETRRIAAEQAAARDALTGLLNRRGFDDHVKRLRASGRWPGNLWLAAIDIDRFKHVNDSHSHAAGDAVLIGIARLLQRECRAGDTAARFGGEEFILLFGAGSEAAAVDLVERIRRRFAETPTVHDGRSIAHTLSAGLIAVPDHPADDTTALIARADAALYAAKQSGRNRVCLAEATGA